MNYVIKFLVSALLIFLAANYLSFLDITLSDGYTSALIFSVILSLVNMFLGNLLRLIGFPINFLTLGLFGFLITLLMIFITDKLYDGVAVSGVLAYLFIAFLPAMTNAVVDTVIKD